MATHEAIPTDSTSAPQRIEIITGHERRRQYSNGDKARLIAEAAQPGRTPWHLLEPALSLASDRS